MLLVKQCSGRYLTIYDGINLAQLLILPLADENKRRIRYLPPHMKIPSSGRGTGGFGSTDIKPYSRPGCKYI